MNLINIYFLIGSKASFLNRFRDNDALYSQAQNFWNELDDSAYIFILLFLVLGIGLAWYYYQPFNNQPGRHYHPKYWLGGLIACFIITLFLTLIMAYLMATPKLTGTWPLELKLSLNNAIYSFITYIITSFIYCNIGLPTNAYRIFKI